MNVTVYLSLVVLAVYGVSAPRLSRRLPPAVGTWLLSVGAAAGAVAASGALVLLSLPLVAQDPAVARAGGWSRRVLAAHDPVRTPVAALALAVVAVGMARMGWAVIRSFRTAAETRRLSATLPVGQELVVTQDKSQYAFALPGRSGHIVASSGLLRALDPGQRRALLAHERAHLVHRHHWHITLVRLCVALCPLLAPLAPATRLACERWADETAAATVGRDVVASALMTAGHGRRHAVPANALAMAADAVAYRIRALRAPGPRLRPWLIALPVALLIIVTVCDGNALAELHHLFERAQASAPRH